MSRRYTIDWDALRRAVEQRPYRSESEWANEFGGSRSCVRHALKKMKVAPQEKTSYSY